MKYLLARIISDPVRNEPRNIGVVVWDNGLAEARFLGYRADLKGFQHDFPDFIDDIEGYKEWVNFWLGIIEAGCVPYRNPENPRQLESIPLSSPKFLAALQATAQGKFILEQRNLPAEALVAPYLDSETPALIEFANRLFDRLARDSSVAARALKWPQLSAEAAERQHRRSLHRHLSKILERFRATAVWLMVKRGNRLHPLLTQNTHNVSYSIELGTAGIVSHVASTKCAYCAPDTRTDPLYFEELKETRSEMAVPVLQRDGTLLGVLNLESNQVNLFSQAQLVTLQAIAAILAPYIVLLEYSRQNSARLPFGWQFHRHGWGLSEVLQDFAFHIVESLGVEASRPSCTFWNADWENEVLWVRATAGFDSEYASERLFTLESFTGDVARAEPGKVFEGRVEDFPRFVATAKANAQGLKRIYATPVYLPGAARACGTVNIYFFSDEGRIEHSLLTEISTIVGHLVETHEKLQPVVAAKFADSELGLKTPGAKFDDAREILSQFFDSRCSIYARRKNSNKLRRVTAEGFERHDLEEGGLTIHEKIASLANIPNQFLRCNGGLGANRSARFLGFSIGEGEDVWGVIHLLRAPDSEPFLTSDEKLISTIAEICKPMFLNWRSDEDLIDVGTEVVANAGMSPAAQEKIKQAGKSLSTLESRRPSTSPFANFLRPIPGTATATTLSTALMQDLLRILNERDGILASVRELVTLRPGPGSNEPVAQELRTFAYYAVGSQDPPDESEIDVERRHIPSTQSENSNAFYCIDCCKIVTFENATCGTMFKTVHALSEKVQSGVCMPLVTWTQGKPVRWVLSLDFSKPMKWESSDIEILMAACRKLTAILSDRTEVYHETAQAFFQDIDKYSLLGRGATSLKMELATGRHGMVEAFARDNSAPVQGPWQEMEGPAGEYGIQINSEGFGYQVPLLCGPFKVGACTFQLHPSKSEADVDAELAAIVKAWTTFSNMISVPASWQSEFVRNPSPNHPGVTVWDENVMFAFPLGAVRPRSE